MSLNPSAAENAFYDPIVALGYKTGLPYIRGVWFFVDPYAGSDSNDGLTLSTAFATLAKAYNACTDGAGDGIAFLSVTSSSTTYSDHEYAPIAWSKWGITVYGVAAVDTILVLVSRRMLLSLLLLQ